MIFLSFGIHVGNTIEIDGNAGAHLCVNTLVVPTNIGHKSLISHLFPSTVAAVKKVLTATFFYYFFEPP